MEKPSYVVKVTDRKTGAVAYLKYPRRVSPAEMDGLSRFLNQVAKNNPEFPPEVVVAHVVDRMSQSKQYAALQVDAQPWDAEVAFGEEPQEQKNRSQRLTFHVRCLADCVAGVTYPSGGMTLEEAMDDAKTRLHELCSFSPPKIISVEEVVEGSGYLADDCPPLAQVVCVDTTFTATPATARCVKFSRPLTQEQDEYFRKCLKTMYDERVGDNDMVVTGAVRAFNNAAAKFGWTVTAEKLEHIEWWNSMVAYGHDLEPELSTVRISRD